MRPGRTRYGRPRVKFADGPPHEPEGKTLLGCHRFEGARSNCQRTHHNVAMRNRRPSGGEASDLRATCPLLNRPAEELQLTLPVGPAEVCAERLAAYAEAGFLRVFLCPLGDELRQFEILQERVVSLIAKGETFVDRGANTRLGLRSLKNVSKPRTSKPNA